jgi:hypothetical protein
VGRNLLQVFGFNFARCLTSHQGGGAETICFRSGSDLAPEPAPAIALELPVISDFMLKRTFFMFLMKENRPNSHAKFLFNMNLDFFKIL